MRAAASSADELQLRQTSSRLHRSEDDFGDEQKIEKASFGNASRANPIHSYVNLTYELSLLGKWLIAPISSVNRPNLRITLHDPVSTCRTYGTHWSVLANRSQVLESGCGLQPYTDGRWPTKPSVYESNRDLLKPPWSLGNGTVSHGLLIWSHLQWGLNHPGLHQPRRSAGGETARGEYRWPALWAFLRG